MEEQETMAITKVSADIALTIFIGYMLSFGLPFSQGNTKIAIVS
jgi:hypothetical protein